MKLLLGKIRIEWLLLCMVFSFGFGVVVWAY